MMIKCPRCEGRGNIICTVSENNEPPCKISLECSACNGKREVSEFAAKIIQENLNFWCHCGNPSGETTYHEDGANPNCHKHNWTCDDCGRVAQVG